MVNIYDMEALDKLKRVSTANIYDVLSRHTGRSVDSGLTDTSIKCMYPERETMIGYACTAMLVCDTPKKENEIVVGERKLLEYLDRSRRPFVTVIQNLDRDPAMGGSIGDCMATYFTALGCAGCITNGGVRDLKEIEKIGFHVFAPGPAVGYFHFRFVEINTPVNIGGLLIDPGDLLAGDVHGIIRIPGDVCIKDLAADVEEYMAAEEKVRRYCMSSEFNLRDLCSKTSELDHMRIPSKEMR